MRGIFDSPGQIFLVFLVFVLLFGAKRLPDAARGLGRSLRIFKSEVSQMTQDTPPSSGDSTHSAHSHHPHHDHGGHHHDGGDNSSGN
jgi:sec-independent protein translocase protein TatA